MTLFHQMGPKSLEKKSSNLELEDFLGLPKLIPAAECDGPSVVLDQESHNIATDKVIEEFLARIRNEEPDLP